ncbi:phosphatase PAP2 family protein [Streptomyces sp. SB3404]|uniref:Phosphatase PAP2 family protein n=1 Tax=Streptomyces boncukensis TaxID=2711219 RepID=A0A6G4WPT7_9ACTN|nr:phosphatase PAP2 family protein [Streptomyces boncukensis]
MRWCAVPLGALGALVVGLVAAGWRPLLDLDSRLAARLHTAALRHPAWTDANRILTDWVWDPWTMRLVLAAAVGWLLWHRAWPAALWCAGTAAVAAGVQQVLKAAIGRDRPGWERPVDSAEYAAMPSGHAMTAAVTCVLLLWLLRGHGVRGAVWGAAVAVAGVSALGVGFTRVWLGVHWPTDVAAGTLLGAALALGALALWPRYALRARPPKTATSSGSSKGRFSSRHREQDTTPGSTSSSPSK